MNKKFIFILLMIIGLILITINFTPIFNIKNEIIVTPVDIDFNSGGSKFLIGKASNLFHVSVYENDIINVGNGVLDTQYNIIEFNPKNLELYDKIKVNSNEKVVFIIPIFTEIAYGHGGFYSYYKDECDESCLKIPIKINNPLSYHSSVNAVKTLRLLGYQFITDIEVDKNPDILKDFDKIIILHNEYVTKKEFDAISNHPNVIYLYPNSLYAEIKVDYSENTISLVKGHGFPTKDIGNGFQWKYDNTHPYEYDTMCENWKFMKISNGVMLNCYPENIIYRDFLLLKTIKEI